MDEYGGLRPVIGSVDRKSARDQYSHYHQSSLSTIDRRKRQPNCANDSFILETILKKYNRHKIPGDSVIVQVEVWVQEITTISDITSDFQVKIIFEKLNPCSTKQFKRNWKTCTILVSQWKYQAVQQR